jgi:hypothetical protein
MAEEIVSSIMYQILRIVFYESYFGDGDVG